MTTLYYNIFCKQFHQNEHFSPFELSLPRIKIGVSNQFSWSKQFRSALIQFSWVPTNRDFTFNIQCRRGFLFHRNPSWVRHLSKAESCSWCQGYLAQESVPIRFFTPTPSEPPKQTFLGLCHTFIPLWQCSPWQAVNGKIYWLKQQFLPPASCDLIR